MRIYIPGRYSRRMRIYIAGRYSRRNEFREARQVLEAHGFYVTSRWLNENKPLNTQMGEDSPEFYINTQEIDLVDIAMAGRLLFFAEDPLAGTPRGGRHVEFGYALGLQIPICVIGPKENVFHYNPIVTHYESLGEFLATH